MVKLCYKANTSAVAQPKQRRCFPGLLSPGIHGATGITVAITLQKNKNLADGGGKEINEGEQQKPD